MYLLTVEFGTAISDFHVIVLDIGNGVFHTLPLYSWIPKIRLHLLFQIFWTIVNNLCITYKYTDTR